MFCGECGMPASALAKAPPVLPELHVEGPAELIDEKPVAEPVVEAPPEPVATDVPAAEPAPALAPSPPITPQTKPNDTVKLDPFPWGLSPTSTGSVPQPAAVSRPSQASVVGNEHEDADETRIVSRRGGGDRFILQFSTGESVTVHGTGLLGRNPVTEPGEYVDQLVTIVDPGKSVSKTHLEFGQERGAFWVSDRYSGNGSIIREPESDPKRCDPGRRYRVVRGTRVDIGEQFFVIS